MTGQPVPILTTGTERTALAFRARLSHRHSGAARRYAARLGARISLLVLSDALAFLLARTGFRAVLESPAFAELFPKLVTSAGPLASPGDPGSMVFFISLFLSLALTGSYARHRVLNTGARLAAATTMAAMAATLPLAAIVGVRSALTENLLVAAGVWAALLLMRAIAERVLERLWPQRRWAEPCVLVGGRDAPTSRVAAAISRPGGDYAIAAHYDISAARSDVSPIQVADSVRSRILACDAEAVVVCETISDDLAEALLETALETGCQLLYPAGAVRVEDPRPRLVWHHDQPFFELGAPVLKTSAVLLKRTTDVVVTTLLLLVSAPLMLAIAAAIKLDSRGPVLFKQARAGRGGWPFDMFKFRTMRVGADAEKLDLAHLNVTGDARLFKIALDPRVTRLGRFLRRWSLDELPQLWNVMRGEMSLVGPRPFFEADFAAYDDHHFRRLDAKPGITGLWQVSGRSDVLHFEEVVFLDRQYIERWSLWLDIGIIFRTVSAVMRRRGAY
ncbi:MAG TPA: exopolysaccharide biosynthesis polyprenyl glycosylphosphotransferase [Gemmatimonadaceae bacterium]|nr:exopolysaccharide biosynthesis polyprenyl glycosylphosphotransferase [Gemmatimonadaceae bacterium]